MGKGVILPDERIIYPNHNLPNPAPAAQIDERPAPNSDGERDLGASPPPPSNSTRTFKDSRETDIFYEQIARKIPLNQEYKSIPTYKTRNDIQLSDDINQPAIPDGINNAPLSLSQVESQPQESVEMAASETSALFSTFPTTQPDEVHDSLLVEMDEPALEITSDENNDFVSRGIRHQYNQLVEPENRIRGGVLQLAMMNNRSFYKHRGRKSKNDRKAGFFPPKPNTKKYLRMW